MFLIARWIEELIELTEEKNKIVKFCILSIEKWSTQVQLKTNKGLMQSRSIKINRGMFWGDSFSQFPFFTTLIPLSHELNRFKCGC
jgi:hypothetical protein